MQIRRVLVRTVQIFQRSLVRRQLNQIPGDKACRYPELPEDLHQQPCRITAGARVSFESLLAGLNTRIQPRYVVNFVSHPSIQVDQKVDRSALLAGEVRQKSPESWSALIDRAVRLEIFSELGRVLKRVVFESRFQKEVERIDR